MTPVESHRKLIQARGRWTGRIHRYLILATLALGAIVLVNHFSAGEPPRTIWAREFEVEPESATRNRLEARLQPVPGQVPRTLLPSSTQRVFETRIREFLDADCARWRVTRGSGGDVAISRVSGSNVDEWLAAIGLSRPPSRRYIIRELAGSEGTAAVSRSEWHEFACEQDGIPTASRRPIDLAGTWRLSAEPSAIADWAATYEGLLTGTTRASSDASSLLGIRGNGEVTHSGYPGVVKQCGVVDRILYVERFGPADAALAPVTIGLIVDEMEIRFPDSLVARRVIQEEGR